MKNRILFLITALCLCFSLQAYASESSPAASEKNPKPFVIPELREWKGGVGTFELKEGARIVYPKNKPELAEIASLFAQDLKNMSGIELEVVAGKASKGDIFITLKGKKKNGEEGYKIAIDDEITIEAGTTRGAIWATRTVLQIAEQNNYTSFPKGEIFDYPD